MNEIWMPIEGYEDRYEVSNTGKVRSLNYRMTGKKKELKPIMQGKGYHAVGLCKNGKMKWGKVHRLVADAFIPNPENKREVNHKDGNKQNNHADNLEWSTASENQKHAYRLGLKRGDPEWGKTLGKTYGKEFGRKHAEMTRKPVWAINANSGFITEFDSATLVEKILGISHSSVQKVCTGQQKRAKGYRFLYASRGDDHE